jgi:MFS transporter, SP family, sugar:H+ symporter
VILVGLSIPGSGKVLERIRGTPAVNEEFDDIAEAARLANLIKHPMANIFKSQYRPQLVISVMFMMFQQFTGGSVRG